MPLETTTTKKKKPTVKRPLKTIRVGTVSAEITQNRAPDGFEYFAYTLSRHFRSGEREVQSKTFFERHVEELHHAAKQASDWIRDQRARSSVQTTN